MLPHTHDKVNHTVYDRRKFAHKCRDAKRGPQEILYYIRLTLLGGGG